MKDITVILTCCNRVDLLRKTLESFFKLNTYPIKEFLAHNDGDDRLFLAIRERYPYIKWHFSNQRIGYAASLDRLLSLVQTDYVFSTEDDWTYYRNPGFIEKSLKILEENPHIHQVWIRDDTDHRHPLNGTEIISGIPVRSVKHGYHKHWNGWSWNPGLRRTNDIRKFFPNGLVEHRDEIDQAKHVQQFDYKAVSLVDGSIKHHGWNRRSMNFKA